MAEKRKYARYFVCDKRRLFHAIVSRWIELTFRRPDTHYYLRIFWRIEIAVLSAASS